MGMKRLLCVLFIIVLCLSGCEKDTVTNDSLFSLDELASFKDRAFIEVNNNKPYFTYDELQRANEAFEEYGELDELGRCTYAIASVDQSLMPTTERGDISMIHPSGWHSDRYDFIDQENLYNRCHLIGRMLTGEDANKQNLITGTRYMNTQGMLPFEEEVADYIKETNHHVLYRVTPIFMGDELVARGVLMEAKSIESDAIEFCVFAYNVQPGVTIDYNTGDNHLDESFFEGDEQNDYVLNTNTLKFHLPDCENI